MVLQTRRSGKACTSARCAARHSRRAAPSGNTSASTRAPLAAPSATPCSAAEPTSSDTWPASTTSSRAADSRRHQKERLGGKCTILEIVGGQLNQERFEIFTTKLCDANTFAVACNILCVMHVLCHNALTLSQLAPSGDPTFTINAYHLAKEFM